MWNFPRYTSRERAFSFLRDALATMGAKAGVGAGAKTGTRARMGAEAGTRASRTVLKIRCKSFLEYLGILVAAAGALATKGFVLESAAGWSNNSSLDLEGREESGKAMEGAAEKRLRQRRPWP